MELYKRSGPALLTDLYELTMMQGYFFYGRRLRAVFDMFFRRQPFNGGYAVFAGLEPLVKTLAALRFDAGDITYLRGTGLFKPAFLDYLAGFRFRGDIYAAQEGTLVFPGEPLLRVHGNIMEAQLVESLLLNVVNFQSLIATKAARVAQAAAGREIIEFGLRRAQGVDGALSASRAAFIGGAAATSNVLAGRLFGIPVRGTMAHSWVMAFRSEGEAFRKYTGLYPGGAYLLVDTYDTLGTGLPAAAAALKKLKAAGGRNYGIRLDSGDLEVLSKCARRALDQAGLPEARIVASNELDEHIIEQLVARGSPIDSFGVGTSLVTAKDDPAFNGVYKLAAKRSGRAYEPSIKISDNPDKISNPHIKNVIRLYGEDGLMAGDLLCLESERAALEAGPARGRAPDLYHPQHFREEKKLGRITGRRALLKRVLAGGEPAAEFPALKDVRLKCLEELSRLPRESRRLLNPQTYRVGLSKALVTLKASLVRKYS